MINPPNIQTSVAVVNLLKFIDSGAIHFMGSFPFDAVIFIFILSNWIIFHLTIKKYKFY